MPARIQNTLRLLGEQIQGLCVGGLSVWNSDQRAEWTWAKVIGSYEALPEPYWETLGSLLGGGRGFPYIVLTPAYDTFRTRVSEKLACVMDCEIHVLERSGKVVTTTCYPIESIRYVEVSSILLDYQVKIHGLTNQGVQASSIFRCSAATDYLFTPVLRKIRMCGALQQGLTDVRDTAPFDPWYRLNFKFMNFARSSLLGGEKVVCAVLQPEIKVERFRIPGKTYYRTVFPTHTCILTNRELILIREEALQDRKDKYGGIWDFIPLDKIASLAVSSKNGHLLALCIRLLTNEEFECLFEEAAAKEVDELAVRFHELTSR